MKTLVVDVKLGDRLAHMDKTALVWTVASSRRTKKGIVLGLVTDAGTFTGKARTRPLADDYEVEVVS